LLLLNRRANDEADNRFRGELLGELLAPSVPDPDAIVRRARLLDVDLDANLVVVVVVPQQAGSVTRTFHDECSRLARNHHGLASALADRFVLLLPGADAGLLAQSVAQELADGGLKATVGGSGPVEDLRSVVRHEDRARRAARLLFGLGRTGHGVSADEVGIYGLLLSDVGDHHIRDFIEEALGAVERYDAARGTALMESLDAYFNSEGNVAAAAETLYIHSNTMYQRLERLDRLLGRDWRTGQSALDLRLALRFRRLLLYIQGGNLHMGPPEGP
jgi:sugar diacid utilization regulator